MMKTIHDLPEDLVEDEILSRVPMTSLRSVRSTCRKWNALCKTRIFLGKGEEAKKQFLMMDSRRICLMNFDLRKDDGEPSIKQVSVLSDQIQISNVLQCDGLLLCVLKDSSRLLFWNPYLGQTIWIEPRHSFQSSDMFALGYDNNNNNLNHKILRISWEDHPDGGKVLGSELYDFTSSSWKVLDDVTPEWKIRSRRESVSLKGNAYFRASVVGFFVCFDFTTERFGPLLRLPLPAFHSYNGLHFVCLSCSQEKQLAVLYQHWLAGTTTIEISVTDKIGPDAVSWTKFLKLNFGYSVYPDSESFLVDVEKKIAMVLVLEKAKGFWCQTAHFIGQKDGYFKSVRIREAPENKINASASNKTWLAPVVCSSYLPSLVQLQSNQPSSSFG